MARTAIPTSTTNDLVTAAWFNTYLRDNESYHYTRLVTNGDLHDHVGGDGATITPAATDFFTDDKIYSGRLADDGTATKLPSGWSSSRTATGTYTITHNLGTANYTVALGSHPRSPHIYNAPGVNSFQVRTVDSTGALVDAEVHFILIKD